MDKDEIKGNLKDAKGRVKRQVGEWTDDENLQGEGTADQAEGKVQKTFGKVKEGAKDLVDSIKDESDDAGSEDFPKKRSA
jgi:uncharacterized protein YjbJ (UPF0337 family)